MSTPDIDNKPIVHKGLKGIIAAETQIAEVDGINGKLTLRGYDISELSGNVEFEEVCYLLWHGKLPSKAEYAALKAEMSAARALPDAVLEALKCVAPYAKGMDDLRIGASMLSVGDETNTWEHGAKPDVEGATRRAARLQAQMPALVAHTYRLGQGLPIVHPKPEHSLAEGFLYMLEGKEPEPARVAGLNAYLVAVSEHGLNASTFAARVIIATNSDMVSALTGAIGALKGWLHGGVPGPVLEMLEEIGTGENAEVWIRNERKEGRRIMGFGHRVYQVRDPRAALLGVAAERMAQMTGDRQLLDLIRVVEEAAIKVLDAEGKDKKLRANVELYAALILHAIDVPSELFTPIFAIGRTSGWTAHMLEQIPMQNIIRPESLYSGPRDLKYTEIADRE
jgi:citrate synthase